MSANPRPLIANIYNPHNQTKVELVAGFVVRKKFFEKIFRDIQTSTMQRPEQHYIIQGVRGMGKTTLLLRIAYEIENTAELNTWLIPVVFNEEEYGIGSLSDVWEKVAEYLEESSTEFLGLHKEIIKHYQSDGYERLAFDLIIKTLQEKKKKIILLIDNIGDILEKFDEKEEQRLREVLLSTPEIRLIGATSVFLERFFDYKRPFFDFFKYLYLDGLNKAEGLELMLKLGEAFHAENIEQIVNNESYRIEVLRRLTGGVVRSMVLLFEIFVENNTGSAFKDLEVLIDRVTPLYKDRMDDLPKQQQKIVAALANFWEAATTKELAEAVRMESKVVSAQLMQLIKNRVVVKIETPTKNHLYRLEERFFNIWYLMRFGRKTDQRMLWLVKFMEDFIGGDTLMLQNRIDGHLFALQNETLDPKAALYLTEAFRQLTKDEFVRYELIEKTEKYLKDKVPELLKELDISDLEDFRILQQAMMLSHENKIEEALSEYYKIKKKGIYVLEEIASINLKLGNINECEKYCWMAIEKGSSRAFSILGDIKKKQNNFEEAIKYYKKAYKKGESFALVDIGRIHQFIYNDYKKAMEYYKKSMKEGEIWWVFDLDYKKMRFRNYLKYGNILDLSNLLGILGKDYKFDIYQRNTVVKILYYIFIERNPKLLLKYWLEIKELVEFNELIKIVENIILLQNNDLEKLNKIEDLEWIFEIRNRFAEKYGKEIEERLLFLNNDSYSLKFLFSNYVKLLLSKKQFYLSYSYFNNEKLKEDLPFLYYATLHYLKEEYPTEYLRMPPELKETVEELVAKIDQMAIDYA